MSHTFRAMGCTVEVAGGSPSARRSIERLFVAREAMFSRFLADSELTRVNASEAKAVFVSDEFAGAVETALAAERATRGLVTPLVHDALVAAGYDRSFETLGPTTPVAPRPLPTASGRLRVTGRLIGRPHGTHLDLAGVVKGMTVDDAAALLDGPGFVSAGGDVTVTTSTVVTLPCGDAITVHAGGIATSGTTTRRWADAHGRSAHHLIDPATGGPAESPWECVTVVAGSCLGADVAAKAAFVLGDDGPDWLDALRLPGRFVDVDGAVSVNPAWARQLELERGAA